MKKSLITKIIYQYIIVFHIALFGFAQTTINIGGLKVIDLNKKNGTLQSYLEGFNYSFILIGKSLFTSTNGSYPLHLFDSKPEISQMVKSFNDVGFIYIKEIASLNNQNEYLDERKMLIEGVDKNHKYFNIDKNELLKIPFDKNSSDYKMLVTDSKGYVKEIININQNKNPFDILLNSISKYSLKYKFPIYTTQTQFKLSDNENKNIELPIFLSIQSNELMSEKNFNYFYGKITLPNSFDLLRGGITKYPNFINIIEPSQLESKSILLGKIKDNEKTIIEAPDEIFTIQSTVEVSYSYWLTTPKVFHIPTDYSDLRLNGDLDHMSNRLFVEINNSVIKGGGKMKKRHEVGIGKFSNYAFMTFAWEFEMNGKNYRGEMFFTNSQNIEHKFTFTYLLDNQKYWDSEIKKIMNSLILFRSGRFDKLK